MTPHCSQDKTQTPKYIFQNPILSPVLTSCANSGNSNSLIFGFYIYKVEIIML